METLLISLKKSGARKLLHDMADMGLIEIKGENVSGNVSNNKLSELKTRIKSRMSETDIHAQLENIRSEWQRNI